MRELPRRDFAVPARLREKLLRHFPGLGAFVGKKIPYLSFEFPGCSDIAAAWH